MMSMVHSQINRAISNAISERVIPEIQNIVSSMSSSGNRDTEASVSPNSQENRECSSGFKSKFAKKDSQSACDLRDIAGRSHYTIIVYYAEQTLQDRLLQLGGLRYRCVIMVILVKSWLSVVPLSR